MVVVIWPHAMPNLKVDVDSADVSESSAIVQIKHVLQLPIREFLRSIVKGDSLNGGLIGDPFYCYTGSRFLKPTEEFRVQQDNTFDWEIDPRIIEPDLILGNFLVCEKRADEINITLVQPGRQTLHSYSMSRNPDAYNGAILAWRRKYERSSSSISAYKPERRYSTFGYQIMSLSYHVADSTSISPSPSMSMANTDVAPFAVFVMICFSLNVPAPSVLGYHAMVSS